jgi:hypothetical protein
LKSNAFVIRHGFCNLETSAGATAGKMQSRAGEAPPQGVHMSKLKEIAWFVAAGGLIATYAVLMFVM